MKEPYSIIHLDIARKYFSPEALQELIACLSENGIAQLELYFSDNQGFRFALDNMTFSVNGKHYDLRPTLGDGLADEASGMCPDGTDMFLTEDDMTTLLSYAKQKGVEIVPAFDMPGHMGAILRFFPQFRYALRGETSITSLDITSTEAVAFSHAILERYAHFFANNGCRYFNAVCDEFVLELGGFASLAAAGQLEVFRDYAASVISLIQSCGLIPRVFNDAVCYENNRSFDLDSAAEVCYCIPSTGAAACIAESHKIINGSSELFWVMGVPSWQTSADKIHNFQPRYFSDGTSTDAAAAMLCFWCDKANAQTESEFLQTAKPIIEAFGRKMSAS